MGCSNITIDNLEKLTHLISQTSYITPRKVSYACFSCGGTDHDRTQC